MQFGTDLNPAHLFPQSLPILLSPSHRTFVSFSFMTPSIVFLGAQKEGLLLFPLVEKLIVSDPLFVLTVRGFSRYQVERKVSHHLLRNSLSNLKYYRLKLESSMCKIRILPQNDHPFHIREWYNFALRQNFRKAVHRIRLSAAQKIPGQYVLVLLAVV